MGAGTSLWPSHSRRRSGCWRCRIAATSEASASRATAAVALTGADVAVCSHRFGGSDTAPPAGFVLTLLRSLMLIQTPSGTCDLNSGEGGGGAGDAKTTGTKIGGGVGALQRDARPSARLARLFPSSPPDSIRIPLLPPPSRLISSRYGSCERGRSASGIPSSLILQKRRPSLICRCGLFLLVTAAAARSVKANSRRRNYGFDVQSLCLGIRD
uniref:Uncharacterized protein n=1 Tax=Leersia perrieri TaxID=77586 RepID=A0A0D9V4W7_9ORYZ